MDWKQDRKHQYQKNKSKIQQQKQQRLVQKQLSEEEDLLINTFLAKATLSQITAFMDKKYSKTIKHSPKLQVYLNMAITKRLNEMPVELKQNQLRKICEILETKFQGMKVKKHPTLPDRFQITKPNIEWKEKDIRGWYNIEEHCFEGSMHLNISIKIVQSWGKDIIRIESTQENAGRFYSVASAKQITGFRVKNDTVDFQRTIQKAIQVLVNYIEWVNKIESKN